MPKTYADLTVANATAGNAILASDFATLFANSNNFRKPPMCRIKKTGNQSISGTTTISWDAQDHDTDDMWSSGGTITAPTAGIYLWSVFVRVTASGAPTDLYLNGPDNARNRLVSATDMRATVSGIWIAAANATTTIALEPNGGTSLSVDGTTAAAFAAFVWLGQVS